MAKGSVKKRTTHNALQTFIHLGQHPMLLVGRAVPPVGNFVQSAETAIADLSLRVDDAHTDARGWRIAGRSNRGSGHGGQVGKSWHQLKIVSHHGGTNS